MLAVNLERVEVAFFISNTIPAGEFGWPEMRRFLKLWRQRFERRFPYAVAFWVKELTRKGTPHLHLVVPWQPGTAPTLEEFRALNDEWWADVVKSSHPKHRQVGCNVAVLRSWQGGVNYLSCYLSEGSAEDPRTADSGKMWGIIGRKNLPVDWLPEIKLTPAEGKFIQRQLLHLQRKKRTYWMTSISNNEKKAVEWRRLKREARWDAGAVGCVGTPISSRVNVLNLEEQIEFHRSMGFRVKRVVPACCRRVKIPLWSIDEDTGKVETLGKSTIKGAADDFDVPTALGEEIHSFSSGWHHARAADVLRLVELVRRQASEAST